MSMKFRCERNAFLAAVQTVSKAVSKGAASSAVLAGIHMKLDENLLTLQGSDIDLTITVTTNVVSEAPGAAVIPAKMLLEVARVVPFGSLNIEITDQEALISADTAEFTIQVYPVQDWPVLPSLEREIAQSLDTAQSQNSQKDAGLHGSVGDNTTGGNVGSDAEHVGAVTIDGKGFREALSQVVRSASTDDTRPVLTGVLMSADKDGLSLVSTDSYRLALSELPDSKLLGEGTSVLVPSRALAEVQKAIGDHDQVTLRLSDRLAEFEVGNMRVSTRLIDGDYPNYQNLIPGTDGNMLQVERERFMEALRRVKLFAQQSTPVRIKMGGGNVELKASTQDVGSASEIVEAIYKGADLTIAFNPSYLIDGLDMATSEEVKLYLVDALKPALLTCADDDSYKYVLMPVRIT